MARIQKRDYFFGAALSMLLTKNRDAKPSLLECTEASCQYVLSTDTSEDCYIYMKYSTSKESNEQMPKDTWQFSISDKDKARINACIQSGKHTLLIFICGNETLSDGDGEVAVLTQNEYVQLAHKSAIRIKVGRNMKKYVIADKPLDKSVPRNRINCRLTDIKDCW